METKSVLSFLCDFASLREFFVLLSRSGEACAPQIFEHEDEDDDDHEFFERPLEKVQHQPPSLRLVLLSCIVRNRRARSLSHARRRLRRWVYFGFFGKLFGRNRGLRMRTNSLWQTRAGNEESVFGR